jgi:hypothetical protein
MIDTNPSDKAITEMALLFSGIERGAEDERADIVAWFRGGIDWGAYAGFANAVADAIENGAHLAKRGEDA